MIYAWCVIWETCRGWKVGFVDEHLIAAWATYWGSKTRLVMHDLSSLMWIKGRICWTRDARIEQLVAVNILDLMKNAWCAAWAACCGSMTWFNGEHLIHEQLVEDWILGSLMNTWCAACCGLKACFDEERLIHELSGLLWIKGVFFYEKRLLHGLSSLMWIEDLIWWRTLDSTAWATCCRSKAWFWWRTPPPICDLSCLLRVEGLISWRIPDSWHEQLIADQMLDLMKNTWCAASWELVVD